MNGWDSFVDQYLTEKRNIEKNKSTFPLVSKPTTKVIVNDKKQRSAYTLAQVILPAAPNDSRNTGDECLFPAFGTSMTMSKFNRKM